MRNLLAGTLVLVSFAFAQAPAARLVRASGDATVSVRPDQAKLYVGVVTQANTAQEAANTNASKVEAVLAQLRQVVGNAGEIRTIGYSLNPNYRYPQGGGLPTLTGYTASNTIEVTLYDLTRVGGLIDAATNAGANTVGGLRFGLRNDEPARRQALAEAARMARARAEAIAQGLNARVGAVITAQEGASVRPVVLTAEATPAARATPVEPGMVEVTAIVSVDVELLP